MERNIAAIEICSKCVKLVVGYELDNKVYVSYTLTKPYSHCVDMGRFSNVPEVVNALREIKVISDASAKLKINIGDALLALPPFGLVVYDHKQATAIIDSIKLSDLKNAFKLIENSNLPSPETTLVDIIPQRYVLDNNKLFINAPIGEKTKTLTLFTKVHVLPEHIANNYHIVLKNGGINVKRKFVAPFAAIQLLATDESIPSDYLLVDIGSNVTTVSSVQNKELLDSYSFSWGGDNITDHIVAAFNINENDAEKYKIRYGIDNRKLNFDPPVCSSDDGNGNEIKHHIDELNSIIKSELDILVKNINSAIDLLTKQSDPSYKKLPMVLIGGGSRLYGLVDYITPKVPSVTVQAAIPKVLGARNPSYFTCLGMLLANSKYNLDWNDNEPRIGSLTRNPK